MPRRECTWPDPAAVRELLYSAAWLVFGYMLLLTLFELVELLRPKPARLRPPPPPPRHAPTPAPSPASDALCPRCAAMSKHKKQFRCVIL